MKSLCVTICSAGTGRPSHADAEFVQCDLRDAEHTLSVVTASNVEAVLHFAALHLVPESVSQPAEYFRTNVVGGINLLDAVRSSRDRQVRLLFHCRRVR